MRRFICRVTRLTAFRQSDGDSVSSPAPGKEKERRRRHPARNGGPGTSVDQPKEQVGRTLRNLPAVLDAFLDAVPEVNADENPR